MNINYTVCIVKSGQILVKLVIGVKDLGGGRRTKNGNYCKLIVIKSPIIIVGHK